MNMHTQHQVLDMPCWVFPFRFAKADVASCSIFPPRSAFGYYTYIIYDITICSTYTNMYLSIYLSLSLYTCVCMYIYIYIHMHTHTVVPIRGLQEYEALFMAPILAVTPMALEPPSGGLVI